MAARSVLTRFNTFRNLLSQTQAHTYCNHATNKKQSKPKKRKPKPIPKKPKSGVALTHTRTGISYTMIKKDDDRLDKRMIRTNLEEQDQNQTVILKGKPVIDAAVSAGFTPLRLYFVDGSVLRGLKPKMLHNTEVFMIGERKLFLWTEADKKCLIAGIFKKQYLPERPTIPVTLVCDHIKDGVSLGILINTAAAVGCEKVIVMDGCVDIWDPTTFIASDGCNLRIPIMSEVTWHSLPKHLPNTSSTVYSVGHTTEIEKPVSTITDIEDIHQVEQDEFSRYLPLLVLSFDRYDYSKDHSVVPVSGDPGGVSLPARKFAHEMFGRGIELPKSAEVLRVNIAVQGSTTLFQIAAQFRRLKE